MFEQVNLGMIGVPLRVKEQVNTLTFVSLKMEDQAYDTMTEESSFSPYPPPPPVTPSVG